MESRRFATVLLAFVGTLRLTLQASAATTPQPIPSPSATPTQGPMLFPEGTIVVVKTRHGLNSYGQEAGAKITYEVVQDVVVNGFVFAKAGDVAVGVIENAQEGRNDLFSQKAANLRVSVDTVYNFCGDKIDTDFCTQRVPPAAGVVRFA